ncbi:MAG: hypothetical protein L0211_07545 [Planctomycetaceae bacterium]|nr:hypothetical protein [Planctomycetaceae bacterium]
MRLSTLSLLLCALIAVTHCGILCAAEPAKTAKSARPEAAVVELFAGMEAGDIEVKVIPKDATGGNITVKNKTDKPLTIKLPEAFAGVPVLAQGFGGGLGGCPGGGLGGGGQGGGNQGFGGGGMGGMMGGMGMGMGGGGMFAVGPDKATKIKFVAICLDHGLKDPSPRVEYQLVPIDEYAKDPAVTEIIKLMVAGKLDQHSAQAAAWHLQNGLTWEELASKIGAKHLNGSIEPYFTAVQLQRAAVATRFAQEHAEKASAGSPSPKSAEE